MTRQVTAKEVFNSSVDFSKTVVTVETFRGTERVTGRGVREFEFTTGTGFNRTTGHFHAGTVFTVQN
jgi:hypothetical protein